MGYPMKIAVLLKQVKYVYARTGSDPDSAFIRQTDLVYLNNPLDEFALVRAVKLKEERRDTEIWVFSLAKELIETETIRALAMGADQFVHLADNLAEPMDAWTTAHVLSRAIARINAELVLCGRTSLDRGYGEIGAFVAAHLSVPYVDPVVNVSFHPQGGKVLLLQRALGKGAREVLEADCPMVLGIGAGSTDSIYPNHVDRLRVAKREIVHWTLQDLDLEASDLEKKVIPGDVVPPRARVKAVPLLDGALPAQKRIDWLLGGGGARRGGLILEGAPQKLAMELLRFLRGKRLLPREEQ